MDYADTLPPNAALEIAHPTAMQRPNVASMEYLVLKTAHSTSVALSLGKLPI